MAGLIHGGGGCRRDVIIKLFATKTDLRYVSDEELLSDEQCRAVLNRYGGLLDDDGLANTSSKVWYDWNVHDAFNKVICDAYRSKYGLELR